MRARAVAAAAVALALAAGAAGAQVPAEGAPGTRVEPAQARLTLEEALRLAEGGNPAVRRAVNDVALNGTEMRTTWLEQLLPTARLDLFTWYRGNLQRTAQDNFGNPIANPTAEWVYFSNSTQNLSLRWDVQGLSLFQRHRRQALVNEGRSLARDAALTEVQTAVRLLYMDALEQRELMESERELLEARRVDLDVAERLFSLALRNRVDVLQAELAVEQQALALQRQDAAYRAALLDLRAELGADVPEPLQLVDEVLPIFDPGALDPDALVGRAREVNPTLRRSGHSIETASHALAEERNGWWPDVSFGIDVYRRAQADAGRALFDAGLGEDLESQFFVSFSMPILTELFGAQQSRQQATVSLRNERESAREARLDVERRVRAAVLTLRSEWASLRLAERAGEIAEEAVRLAREEYRLGTLRFDELRPTLDAEAETRRQVIQARHAFVEALLRLEEAVGEPVRSPGAGPTAATAPATPGPARRAPGPR